ncbi:hypothetical protein BDQ12DRAFT_293178 [Crucibulum laeve]|uniref:AB hydrolase-1 domain-containing protein n=1 Tax=Crucibulum laeve TaxID=68775 RepID=A0A5C3MFZ1_9AGAR|nr:hypothetical protein BDQ12DRAFT_293178 [Crucibulum laeve]
MLLGVIHALLASHISIPCMATQPESRQATFTAETRSPTQWNVELSTEWNVLGPFPIHAREQHFLSPSFPLNLSEPIDYSKTWPSAYADGGFVGWGTTNSDSSGLLHVAFPDIRWNYIRSTEGWAGLQHHAVLQGILTIYPPAGSSPELIISPPQIRVHLKQGSYFTILPFSDAQSGIIPEWYAGDIYAMERAIPRAVSLPSGPSTTSPTKYKILISGDYEIRLFGDPRARNSEIPVQEITVTAEVDSIYEDIIHEPAQDIVCDFIDGYAFGDSIGVGIRVTSGWWTVTKVSYKSDKVHKVIRLGLVRGTRIAPSQLRVIPITISQDGPYQHLVIEMEITLSSNEHSKVILISIPIKHYQTNMIPGPGTFKASYLFAESMPTVFLATPPLDKYIEPRPPILALHGAGVDIIGQPFWADALPRNKGRWIIMPTGRTSWGLDWHGPSAAEAWASVDALETMLSTHNRWNFPTLKSNTPVVVIGHSNGGQGAWYLASRFPDRVLGVVPAAGYIKSQSYVPLILSRAAHFSDPALRSVLESSLTPDDNDVHLSNLADIPVLAVHGGIDGNVPVWHSRELVGIVKTWASHANITLREDVGKNHWYPSVFDNPAVQAFLNDLPDHHQRPPKFTITVSEPQISGSLFGFSIVNLNVPGRISRLHIEIVGDLINIITSNVQTFSLALEYYDTTSLRFTVDGAPISMSTEVKDTEKALFFRDHQRTWQIVLHPTVSIQPPSRLQSILTSDGPIVLVVSDETQPREMSMALRIAHDLHLYHRLDAEILRKQEYADITPEDNSRVHRGNVVIIGTFSSPLVQRVLREGRTPFVSQHSRMLLNGLPYDYTKHATLFLHPHPTQVTAKILLLLYDDIPSLERGGRLFPIRTGVCVPAWLSIGPSADRIGAAGVNGAGVWGTNWSWSEISSWMP